MLRPWNFGIGIRRDGDTPLHTQVVQAVIDAILRKRLSPNDVMPGSRELAHRLGINRKTAVSAYDELVAQGWLETQDKRGTFVAAKLPRLDAAQLPASRDKPFLVRHRAGASSAFLPPVLEAWPDRPAKDWIDFTDGVPDTRLIPYALLARAFRHALVTTARTNQLGYGDPRGSRTLREALTTMLNMERGLDTSPDGLCVVRGSQMGIYLAARILVRPGDSVAFENLSYGPARQAFQSCGATVHGVAQDEHGLLPNSLEALCRKQRIRAVYVTPHHQFPTTVMMPAERRLRLLMLAEQFGFAVVEDDYDHEFHFDRRPMLPMASVDRSGTVIYVGSLSKVLAPGLRVGYIAASPDIVARCAGEIMCIDRQGNAVNELAVAELMNSGELKRHIRRTLRVYEQRRSDAAQLIRQELPTQVDFEVPAGGLAFWLRCAQGLDMDALAQEALAKRVRILSGSQFAVERDTASGIRLGFASLDDDAMKLGLRRLKSAFAALARKG